MTQETFNRMLAKARNRVAEMDAIDAKHGYTSPASALAQTASVAIEVGLLGDDEGPIFDAMVYLEQLQSAK